MVKIKITSLDKIFSKYIKMRDKCCQRCGGTGGLQTSHFIGRARKSVRWDEDNARLLCFGCHQYFHAHPIEHVQWFMDYLGEEKIDLLMARNRERQKPDIEMIALYLKTKIKELDYTPNLLPDAPEPKIRGVKAKGRGKIKEG